MAGQDAPCRSLQVPRTEVCSVDARAQLRVQHGKEAKPSICSPITAPQGNVARSRFFTLAQGLAPTLGCNHCVEEALTIGLRLINTWREGLANGLSAKGRNIAGFPKKKKKCLHGTVKGALILLWLYATIPKMTTGLGDVQEQGMSKGWRCLSQGRSS